MWVENTAAFLADFAVSCTLAGATVQAIFDNGYAAGAVGVIGVASSQPSLTLATASVPANPVGSAVVVSGASYLVAAHEPDGTGMSLLLLEAA